ncbi:MAG: PHP domain-containing protein [Ruminococcaceae bacterium]|nr:PHP domain-containing protein [Oscillospiraceae bacterium]
MDYNYHTHTVRCGHASGSEEEYVIRAIENGIKYMGFSDHIPLKFPDGKESGHRIPVCDGRAYCDEIKALAEKYKDKIEIKVGFEMEYYPEYFERTLKEAKEYGAEYLILGQHYIKPENTGVFPTIKQNESVEELKEYVSTLISAMKTGVFTYVAHPDIFNFVGDTEVYKEECKRLCEASKSLDIPLEINFLGIRSTRNYPNDIFWQIVGEAGAPVTFGFDAHDTQNAYDGESLIYASEMVKKFSLNYIGKPQIVTI